MPPDAPDSISARASPQTPLGSSQRSPTSLGWIQGVLLLGEGNGEKKTKKKNEEKWGREEGNKKERNREKKRNIPPLAEA